MDPNGWRRWGMALALALSWAAPTVALAEDGAAKKPRASEILLKMTETLHRAKAFSFHGEVDFDDVLPSGFKVQYAGSFDVVLRKPDGLMVDYQDDVSAKRIWYDGKSMTLFDSDHNVVASAPAADKVGPALDEFEAAYGVRLPVSDLILSDADTLLKNVSRKGWIGLHEVDGAACDHLAFVGEHVDAQIWVARDTNLPRKLVITYKHLPKSPQYVTHLMDWNLSPDVDDSTFAAKAPDDAIKAEFLQIEEARR